MKKRLLIPIYIILFSLLIGCINQSSSTKAPKFSAAELQQAEQIRNNLFTPGSVTIRGTIKGVATFMIQIEKIAIILMIYITQRHLTLTLLVTLRYHLMFPLP